MSKKYAFQSLDRIGCKKLSHFPSLFPNLKFYFLNSRHQSKSHGQSRTRGFVPKFKNYLIILRKNNFDQGSSNEIWQTKTMYLLTLYYYKLVLLERISNILPFLINTGLPHSFLELKYWLTMISKTNVKILTVLWSGNFLLVIQHLSVLQWNWQSDPTSARTHTLRTELNAANCLTVGQIYSHR